jgi:hypothetical protein
MTAIPLVGIPTLVNVCPKQTTAKIRQHGLW